MLLLVIAKMNYLLVITCIINLLLLCYYGTQVSEIQVTAKRGKSHLFKVTFYWLIGKLSLGRDRMNENFQNIKKKGNSPISKNLREFNFFFSS